MKIQALMLAGVLAAMAGCNDEDTAVVVRSPTLAGAVVQVDGVTSAILFSTTDAFVPINGTVVIKSEDAAAAAAAAVNNYYSPAGCATASRDGSTVTYQLNNCNGPLGITGLNGQIKATYSSQSNGVVVTVKSSDLTSSNASLSIEAQAVYSQNGAARSLAITNRSSAKASDGTEISENQSSTLTWNQGDVCATLNGSGSLDVNGKSISQRANNVVACSNRCPMSGSLQLSGSNGSSGTVTFNGNATAPFTSSSGESGTVTIACTVAVQTQALSSPTN